ncbi:MULTISPECIES: transcriptional regulator PpsR [Rhodopseudomonas]|uniref:Transcriptional regulator n=1 Tax=Rhodopseudomonas palustris TaxID=1076 RepID=A0A0D7EL42_RHOPL|nr:MULTISPECIES: transcriptional regulator PpsR [Rhodopseudomonas]KIZ41245.1 transcriptional regulator [Rhodopseudomonas palustris]MDF3813374.1 transcriptional regulator PpsR [Rhodopseudomonas sp. BAL398]WOK20698.1 transcriptional regulator PpsR [Rhodopseudomonas sp. BAL398]
MAAKPVQPDITLLLDMDGVIRDATLSSAMANESVDGWLGRAWTDVAGDSGGDKVRRMVEDARSSGISAFRQINQRFPSGVEIPMEFTTMLLGDRAGMLAVGKNLQAVTELHARLIAAQQTMERDYWRLREIETRYRLVFDASNEAVVIVSASDLRIVEANRAAVEALSASERRNEDLAGREILQDVALQDREVVREMLARVRARGKALSILVHLGQDAKPWMLRGSLMSSESGQVFLLQFTAAAVAARGGDHDEQATLKGLIDRVPDGFVALDAAGIIRHANQAFLDIVQIGSKGSVIGETLARWLSQPGADLSVLLSNLQRYKTVRLFSTVIHGELGSETEVEISAVAGDGGDQNYIGVLMRNISRRLSSTGEGDSLRAALGPISEQLGRSSLRKLVKNTVSIVEQHYVKEALEASRGNRTATAELLGLSRQSLYAKLNRYGLEDREPESQDGSED